MTVPNYIESVSKRYKQGNATELTFRGDLQQLIESLLPDIKATNEPKRQTSGAPDYILMAGKARLLSDVIEKAENSGEANQQNSTLKD